MITVIVVDDKPELASLALPHTPAVAQPAAHVVALYVAPFTGKVTAVVGAVLSIQIGPKLALAELPALSVAVPLVDDVCPVVLNT